MQDDGWRAVRAGLGAGQGKRATRAGAVFKALGVRITSGRAASGA
jgi:hypothetical protein